MRGMASAGWRARSHSSVGWPPWVSRSPTHWMCRAALATTYRLPSESDCSSWALAGCWRWRNLQSATPDRELDREAGDIERPYIGPRGREAPGERVCYPIPPHDGAALLDPRPRSARRLRSRTSAGVQVSHGVAVAHGLRLPCVLKGNGDDHVLHLSSLWNALRHRVSGRRGARALDVPEEAVRGARTACRRTTTESPCATPAARRTPTARADRRSGGGRANPGRGARAIGHPGASGGASA